MKGFYPAEVIDNNDKQKKGRIKIKIHHLHKDIANNKLPYAYPSTLPYGNSDKYGVNIIPEKGSFVWVWFEDSDELFQYPYYITGIVFSDKSPATLFESKVKSKVSSQSQYPNTQFMYFVNGICVAIDSSTNNPEVIIYHPKDSHIFINKEGEIEIKAGSVATEKALLGESLKQWLSTHTHMTGVGQSSPPMETSQLEQLVSQKFKHN